MRLTLRTLLAYLDDVLDPADKEELAQKIESSDFAEDLVHRTRDTARRLRLSAPQPIGTGMGLDPNTVAEYLDNVLPPDSVGDFERICLESDVHLAEAAACHHVLTMILGQPADIDPIARQRMYTIMTEAGERKKLRIEAAHTPAPVATTVAIATPTYPVQMADVEPAPRKVEIPEYLRAGAWWQSWSVAAGLAAVVLVGISILFATGLKGWFSKAPPTTAMAPAPAASNTENQTANAIPTVEPTATNTATEPVTENAVTQTAPAGALGAPPPPLTPGLSSTAPTPPVQSPPVQPQPVTKTGEPDRYAASGTANLQAATTAQPPATPVAAPATAPVTAAPTTGAAAANAPNEKNADDENPFGPLQSAPAKPGSEYAVPGNTAAQPASGAATANVPTTPAVPPAEAAKNAALPAAATNPPANVPATDAGTAAPKADTVAANAATPDPSALDAGGQAGVTAKAPAGPVELGTYIGGKTVLLRYDGKAGAWFRAEPCAAVVAGERILSLPEFRPKVAMVSGLQLDLSGGTQVLVGGETDAPKADAESAAAVAAIPSVELVYGRLMVVNTTDGEKQIRLKLGSSIGEAKLARNTTLAVEVERKHVPGADPRKAPAPVECRLFAPEGEVVWKDGAGTKTIEKASRWTVGAAGATEPVADTAPPDWIYNEPIVQVTEQRYAPKLESALVSNIPVDTQLLEIFQKSKQREAKSLVARSSIHVGQFEPFVKALGDSEQKSNWKTHIDTLRSAMALSPESANKVWQTLVDQRGRPAAGDLFEMLCGYSADAIGSTPEQMKTGAIAQLIDRLEDNNLDYRVLAVQDLAEITGRRLMLNPAANQPERTLAIRKWRARLDAGDLKPVATTEK